MYSTQGNQVATFNVSGWDLAYDRKAKAFWVADKKLTKIAAAKGEVILSLNLKTWCASSVDIDPKSGAAWVAVRKHPNIAGTENRLLKISPEGRELMSVGLGEKPVSSVRRTEQW